jgi:two-component system chemotaxis response regulator CheB
VLSGSLDDGSAGVRAVRSRDGLVAVQDPDDALYGSMPRNARAAAEPDILAPAKDLGPLVARRAGEPVGPPEQQRHDTLREMQSERSVAEFDLAALRGPHRPGTPSGFSCPDRQGTLFEINDEGHFRVRCRVGHARGVVGLLARQDASLEHALWIALRNLDEKAALCHRMADLARGRSKLLTAERSEEAAQEAERAAVTMHTLLIQRPATDPVADRDVS